MTRARSDTANESVTIRAPRDLPLRWLTPEVWAGQAMAQPLALLNDHAHLEKKAALNALEMLNRWPEPSPPENWVAAMTAIARDEVEHLATVVKLIARRGGRLSRMHRNPYASGLRSAVRLGQGPDELADRLMVSALIEARSCERFYLLAESVDDEQLRRLYRNLWASEAGHYRTFIDLALQLHTSAPVAERWNQMLELEAKLIASQAPGPRIHSGVA